MKRKVITVFFGTITLVLLTSGTKDIASSGAPIGSTGAPGELTCGKAGCHTGIDNVNNINTGTGLLSITSEQNITNYVPGEIYTLTVALQEAGVNRFGFSLSVLDANNNKAGTLLVTDSLRTQIFEGGLQFTGRQYMTYRMVGTNPYQPGKGLWTFKWKAPDHDLGNITFYAAGISANNDATDKGDLVYTQSLVSKYQPVGIRSNEKGNFSFTVFPNPVTDILNIKMNHVNHDHLSFKLYDIQGKFISDLKNSQTSISNETITFQMSNFEPGIYLLKIQSSTFSETKKIYLIN
jgi:hypothetical protein